MNELEKNLTCCPKCDHHYRMSATDRIQLLADPGSFQELYTEIQSTDPLEFRDTESYKSRLKRHQKGDPSREAVKVGLCMIEGYPVALGVMDFSFMGGSMGSVVGERLTRLIERASFERLPLIIVSASGGARMQESTFSLMQMAKTSAALARLSEEGLPFFSVLTNPTTGGVTASFATLGDLIIAEPGALIGFAGPRVIEQSLKKKLPEGAQQPPFHQENGMIDMIVPRKELRAQLAQLVEMLTGNRRAMRFRMQRAFLHRERNQEINQLQELLRTSEVQ